MLTKPKFQNISKDQKERVVAAFFKAKFPGYQVKSGVNVNVPAGYTVRVAAQLTAEVESELIKKVFVVLEEFNTYISKVDIDTVVEYSEQLHQAGVFDPKRDEFWLVTNQKWTYEAYVYSKGKIVLMDTDTLIEGVNKILGKESKKSSDLRKNLERIGLSV
ncbi:TPA: hypothetical protein H1016_02830 [archaeon]|uniref:Uncharacterized protein n=1 Tax=Candidatus Naiadarchaeum limnaeum TaxID=2756139 RepID=A0A832V1H8_9ARCH|nr:hypothetical protein [Candidatus Naiadarchaeum limnaeum]